MSEPTTEAEATPSEQGNPDDAASSLGDAGKKALDAMKAERNAAKQELARLQTQLDEINRANESALERAQREAREAQEAASAATIEALRFRIAAEAGITDNVDLILTAPDEETMRRQAQLWVERTSAPTGPRPDPTQGGSGQSLGLNSDGLEDALKTKLGIA